MNLRFEAYRTGATMILRTVYLRGGRRFSVIDRAKISRSTVRALAAEGRTARDIVVLTGYGLDFVLQELEKTKLMR